jgi:hypothetical protein
MMIPPHLFILLCVILFDIAAACASEGADIGILAAKLMRILKGELSPVPGLRSPGPVFVRVNGSTRKASKGVYSEYKQYAERLQAALTKQGRGLEQRYNLCFSRLEGVLEFYYLLGEHRDLSSRRTLHITSAAHFRNAYVAFTFQFLTDVDQWAEALTLTNVDYAGVATP